MKLQNILREKIARYHLCKLQSLAIRGNKNWSFGASAAMGGDQAAGKVQVRWAK